MSEFSPVVLLGAGHDRSQFDCGVEPLDVYLKQYALQNQKKGMVRNYVVCRGTRVVGYYSLAYGSAAQADAPAALTKGTGKYPVPLMILARLAVDLREKGQGLGRALLKDAILRTLQAADIAGASRPSSCRRRTRTLDGSTPGTVSSPPRATLSISSSRSIRCVNSGRRAR